MAISQVRPNQWLQLVEKLCISLKVEKTFFFLKLSSSLLKFLILSTVCRNSDKKMCAWWSSSQQIGLVLLNTVESIGEMSTEYFLLQVHKDVKSSSGNG